MIEMFRYLTGILDEKERNVCKVLAVCNLISPVTGLFHFSVIIYIMNIVLREQKASGEIIAFTFAMSGVSILKGLFDLYQCRLRQRFVYEGAQKLSEKMYELLLKEDLAHHGQRSAMQAVALVRSDTQSCMNVIVTCISIWINTLAMAGYFAVFIAVSKWAGIVSCGMFMLLMAVMYLYYRDQVRTYGERSRRYAIKANAQVTIAYGNYKEMKIADSADVILQRYRHAGGEYAQIQMQFQYKKGIISLIMQNGVMAVMFIILGCFLWNPGENAKVFLASMAVYLTMLIRLIPMAYGIVDGLNDVKYSQKSYEALREGMERYAAIKEREKAKEKIRQKKLTFRQGLFIHGLTFSYDGRKQIFQNASLEIPAGCCVAVIGVSGIGKTTFLDLILGLLQPQAGHILYDDYDIVTHTDRQGACEADIGTVTSYIPQDVYLNGETVCNNVSFFARESEADDKRVVECLKCAQIWEDVERMPEGIHTLIGENGTVISGGQRQRIALARALYKDFELLVMDEPTAALDMETEMAIIDSIRQVKGDKTILIATHHMSLAHECDMIYRIEGQRLVRVK